MGFIETAGDLPVGTVVVGKYRIDGVLGSGGMGIVYAAHQMFMDQRVALKLLIPEALTGSEAVTRFITEARHAAKIPGDNVCRILDVGLLDTGLPYIAMEYLEGRSLDALAAEWGVIPMQDAARWILEALAAVAHAHARGIVHRDLKPSNLFLAKREDGTAVVKVLDFGISRSVDSAQHKLTSTRSMLGSPGYISPEHIRNSKAADPRSDLWSLGVVLYELVSSKPPFDGYSVVETIAAILESEPPPLTSPKEVLPPAFSAVVHRCLAKSLDARFQDVAELAQGLAPFAGPDGPMLAERVKKAFAPAGSRASQPMVDAPLAPAPAQDAGASPGRPSTGRLWASQSTVITPRTRRHTVGAWVAGSCLVFGAVGAGAFASRYVGPDYAPAAGGPAATSEPPGAASTQQPVAASPRSPASAEPPSARPPPTATAAESAAPSVDAGPTPRRSRPRATSGSAKTPSPLSTSRD